MFSPILKSWRLIFYKLCIYSSGIINNPKPIFIGISMHATISLMEDIPRSLEIKRNWRVNIGNSFTEMGVFTLLIVDVTSGVGSESGASGGRPAPKRPIIRWTILSSIIACITAILIIQIFRMLMLLPLAALAEGHVVLKMWSDIWETLSFWKSGRSRFCIFSWGLITLNFLEFDSEITCLLIQSTMLIFCAVFKGRIGAFWFLCTITRWSLIWRQTILSFLLWAFSLTYLDLSCLITSIFLSSFWGPGRLSCLIVHDLLVFSLLFSTEIVQIPIFKEFALNLKNCVEVLRMLLLSLCSWTERANSFVHDARLVLVEMLVRFVLWEFMECRCIYLGINWLKIHPIITFIERNWNINEFVTVVFKLLNSRFETRVQLFP